MQFHPDGTPEQHRAFNEMQRLATTPQNAVRMMRARTEMDIRSLVPRVSCPTLVLHARHDQRIPYDEGRRSRRSSPARVSFSSRAATTS